MAKRIDYDILGNYPDYLKVIRGFDERRIRELCSPLIRLITENGYSTEQFLRDSYDEIYETIFPGIVYRSKSARGRDLRQAINNYRLYHIQTEDENNEVKE